jgi:DNA primase
MKMQGCSFREAEAFCAEVLQYPQHHFRAPIVCPAQQSPAVQQQHDTSKLKRATKLWQQGVPIAGTLAERYLVGRGLAGPWPESLRFVSQVWHHQERRHFPCMVALITDGKNLLISVHQTFLSVDGNGKAPVRNPRLFLGSTGSGAIRLAPPALTLALVEGIEDGLTLRMACPDLAVWSGISANNLAKVSLPFEVRTVVLCGDNDLAGCKGVLEAVHIFQEQGRRVVCVFPQGKDVKDFNDLLRKE